MKKFFITFMLVGALTFLMNYELSAQNFSPGELIVNANIGTGTGTNLIGTLDYGIAENISVGGGLWHRSISIFGISASTTFLLARGQYHFGDVVDVEGLDLYGGGELAIGLGSGGGTNFSIMPGARYWVSDKIGIHAELPIFLGSGGGSHFRIGASFRLN
jgi:hypothetical protein